MVNAPEERTIRDLVVPRLHAARWPADRIVREYPITNSRREVVGGRVRRGMPLRADIVLRHPQSGHPITAVEVKKTARSEHDGVTQAKDYGMRLDLPLVYATNGRKIIEIDLRRGTQHEVPAYRSAEELWQTFVSAEEFNPQAQTFFSIPYSRELTDRSTGLIKQMRYYQHGAAQAVLRAIARGDRRLLAVLATGSGKSMLAAQISHVLWEARWPRGQGAPDPRPRILYLADRDVLVADPLVHYFTPIFRSEEVHRIRREPRAHKRVYFALYQALEEIFEQYEPDFFDLVIVDECHRGSAREDAEWRKILEHFASAVQLGMTATPRTDGEADNLTYFGEPVYTYSLRQGVADGFLAPFQTIRVPLSSDIDGIHIPEGVIDDEGVEIPEGDYGPSQFERTLVLPRRTEAAAQFLSDYLRRTDRTAKTIVFCVNQDHAARFAAAIGNLNADLVAEMPYWAQRITSDEGERGAVLLGQFQDGDSPYPVVVTSSDMLTTGVDVPSVRNLVFFSRVQSTARFKQMLGRGTRLDEERGKEFFTVIDFTGATDRFADPGFDGPAIRVIHAGVDQIPECGDDLVVDEPQDVEVRETGVEFVAEEGGELPEEIVEDPAELDSVQARGHRYVLAGHEVYVLGMTMHVLDTSAGLRMRVVRIEDWVRDRVLDLGYDAESLRLQWANAMSRSALVEALGELLPLSLEDLARELGHPEIDPLDLVLHLAYGSRLRSRADRAARLTLTQRQFLDRFGPAARDILDRVLEKYVEHGPRELEPGVLEVPPFAELGSVTELAERFGGPVELRTAFDELNASLYAS